MDVGYFQNDRRRMQSAADSAAVAGEREIVAGNELSVTSAAQNDASLNGFTNGTGSVTVQVNNPPTGGAHAGDSSVVEVIVTRPEPTHLLGVIGISTVNVSARAVAIEKGTPDSSMRSIPAIATRSSSSARRCFIPTAESSTIPTIPRRCRSISSR